MNIVNDYYLCARIRRRASGHSGPFEGQPLQGQVWIPRFSKVRNLNIVAVITSITTIVPARAAMALLPTSPRPADQWNNPLSGQSRGNRLLPQPTAPPA